MKIKLTNSLPLIIVFIFFVDSLANAFTSLPIGAAGITILSILLILAFISKPNKLSAVDSICVYSAATILILPCFKFIFYQDLILSDFSDAAFLSAFMMTPMTLGYIHTNTSQKTYIRYGAVFFIASLLLIAPSFFSIESGTASMGSTIHETSSDLEYLRGYNQGLFRYPHIASYFFLFSLIFFSALYYSRVNKPFSFLLATLSLLIVTYTGSRAGIFALVAAIIAMTTTSKSNRKWAVIFSALLVLIFLNIYKIAAILEGRFLYQYITFFITALENISRLSRIIIWSSWLESVSTFNSVELLFGRPFSYSYKENLYRTGTSVWFHNDWLSTLYSYGVFGLIGLTATYASLWHHLNALLPRRSITIGILTISAFLSITNGFYYYYPILLLNTAICAFLIKPGSSTLPHTHNRHSNK